jgi:hypothetical protein
MKKSALIKGAFTKTEHGFTGKLKILAIKATITLQPNDDKDSHPDFIVLHGENEIGVAWNRNDGRQPDHPPPFVRASRWPCRVPGIKQGSPIFVRLEMARVDAGDVGAAVSVQIGDGACGGAHAPFVEIGAEPSPGGAIVGV